MSALTSIGDAAKHTGLPVKTIRYYEEIGLVLPRRSANGYRVFGPTEVHELTFVARARALGFSIEECRALLALYRDKDRASGEVKSIARAHLRDIEAKITDLEAMRQTLSHLVETCAGDDRPDCPILAGLAG
ncbi:MAG: Cu(I)-responsive transcriptional regulator [Pseudomonadota bacterium]